MLQYGCTALVHLETAHLHVAASGSCAHWAHQVKLVLKTRPDLEQEAYPLSNWQTTVSLLLLQEHCAFQTRPNINLGSSAAKRRVPAALPLVLA